MRLYYTYSGDFLTQQKEPTQSLGGCRSETPVPNGRSGNLFSDLSHYTLEKQSKSTIGLILRNELETVSSLRFWFEIPEDSLCDFELSIVALNSQKRMEILDSVDAEPYYSEFLSASNEESAVALNQSFTKDSELGLWIRRSFNKEKVDELLSPDLLYNLDKAIVGHNQVEEARLRKLISTYTERVQLKIDWVI